MMLHRHFEATREEPVRPADVIPEGHDIIETKAPEQPVEETAKEPVKRNGRTKKTK